MHIDNILKDMGLGERIQDGTVSTPKIADSAITSDKLADGAFSTEKIADQAVTTGKIADANVVTAKIADLAITTTKIADQGVTTPKIADKAVSTLKIADGAVTTPKIADGAVSNAKIADGAIDSVKLGLDARNYILSQVGSLGGMPLDVTSDFGFTPIIRFFEWWSISSSTPDSWAPRYAQTWANEMRERSGAAWRFFRGLDYMSQYHGRWYDDQNQLSTYSGWYYSDNVSVVCMKNITNAAQSFSPYIYYSSDYNNNNSATASVAYLIFDPNTKPSLGGFTNLWEQTSSTITNTNFSVSVPAGQVIIFVLKTSPQSYTAYGNSYYYHNYHGFFNFNTTNNMSTNFKPHIATYRRLLQGKWD